LTSAKFADVEAEMSPALPTFGASGTPAPAVAAPSTGTGSAVLGGALNYGSGAAAGSMFSGGLAGLASSYAGAYSDALDANQTNYNNILAGYQQLEGNQQTAQQGIQAGYGSLTNQVMNTIQGADQSQINATNAAYSTGIGNANQSLINSGLGNTTVQMSTDAGLQLQQQQALTNVANQFAQTQAGYQSNLGLAGLNYANQASQQNTALGAQQLQWMNSVSAPYPNAQAYSQLAQQYGATEQANANRALQAQQLARLGQGPMRSGGGAPGLGQTQPNPAYPSQGASLSGGYGGYPQGGSMTNASVSGSTGSGMGNPYLGTNTPNPYLPASPVSGQVYGNAQPSAGASAYYPGGSMNSGYAGAAGAVLGGMGLGAATVPATTSGDTTAGESYGYYG
jgi:hypothetical protein